MHEQNGLTQPSQKRRSRKALLAVALTLVLLASLSAAILAGKSSIGDFVWHDTNADGIADNGTANPQEFGINDVVVELWEDNGVIGVFEPGIDVRIATSTTLNFPGSGNVDDDGYYDFNANGGTGSDPEYYLVVITDTNFLPGNALDGYVYTGDLANEAYSGTEPRAVTLDDIILEVNNADFAYAKASATITKTAGNAADGEIEYLNGPTGATTYYYTVTNTGEVALDLNEGIPSAPDYGVSDDLCSPLVGPTSGDANSNGYLDVGEIWTYTCDATGLTGTITNTATVTGNAVDVEPIGGGFFDVTDLPGEDVVVTDTAVVDVVNPAVEIQKTVYGPPDGSHNSGASCGTSGELYDGPLGDEITYCFEVTNTGDTRLAVQIVDADLNIDETDLTLLSGSVPLDTPSGVAVYYYETTVTGPLVNTAVVTGTAVDENDVPLPDIDPVSDTDIATVTVPPTPGAIGDFIWYDTDGDGYQDVDEPGISNVTVNLTGPGGINITTTTGSDGGYIFTDLPEGNYVVTVTDANDVLVDDLGNDYTQILANQAQPSPLNVTLGAGEFYEDADFGFLDEPEDGQNAIIGDTVFYDGDGDGIQDPGEPGMPGVTVVITDSEGTPYSGVTDENGNYQIEVPTGVTLTYTVSPVDATVDPQAPISTTPDPVSVPPLTAGEQYLDADFGFTEDPGGPPLGSIGDQVWVDTNGDGFHGSPITEPGIPGVTIDLIDTATGLVFATTVTAADGTYSFDGVPDGSYEVGVTDTSNVLTDYVPTTGILVDTAVNGTSKTQPYSVTLVNGVGVSPDGDNSEWADFGYVKDPESPPETGVIGDQIFFDANGNGTFEPELGDYGIPGVEVELLVGNQVSQTITSGSSGLYDFTGLPAGTYEVQVADTVTNTAILGDYNITTWNNLPGVNDENQVDPADPQPYQVILAADGSTDFTADFGYTLPPLIGDFIWWDVDGDGIQDPDEPGIPSVEVQISGPGGTITTTTDANGGYLFPNLDPGTYIVQIPASEFAPDGPLEDFAGSPTGEGGDPSLDSDFDPITHQVVVTLDNGEQNFDIDGGFAPVSSFEVGKFLTIPFPDDPVRTGDPISFTIRVTNTGDSIIVTLPLSDTYNPDFMDYDQTMPPVPAPTSVDEINGVLVWDDLLPGDPTLPIGQLLPGQPMEVVVYFIGLLDTVDPNNNNPDPGGETINHALVPFIQVVPPPTPDNPPGTFPPSDPGVPPEEAEDGVVILNPTSVRIASAIVRRTGSDALVEWTTATESDILGFNIQRVVNGDVTQANDAMTEADFPGQSNGSSYSFVDTNLGNALTFYRLEIITTAGQEEIHHIGILPPEMSYMYLPFVNVQ